MINDVLSKLDGVKQVGSNKWKAKCPVHNDNNPSMTVSVKDNKVLCYCFSCQATGKDVAEAIGLPVSSLFADKLQVDKSEWRRKKLLEEKASDEMFLKIYRSWEQAGKYIPWSDKKRYKIAINRVQSIENILASFA